ncbi:MAG: DUF542 domain-containing protein [Chthonomonadales bacterium]
MNTVSSNALVGALVAEQPGRARVFEELGIDYCCGGQRPLADVCNEQGLKLDEVLRRIAEADAAPEPSGQDWTEASLGDLVEHIVETHHAYLRDNLPRIGHLTQRVAQAHGANHPEVVEVADVFTSLHSELESHMMKEERILFPLIVQMEQTGQAGWAPGGSIANPISVMEAEHQDAGEALENFRTLTHGYVPPRGRVQHLPGHAPCPR